MCAASSLRFQMNIGTALPLIVVADADPEIREAVAGFMSARGYHVETCGDAATANALLVSQNVDVLIADLAMRDVDGVDVLAFARSAAPATRVIAIASNASVRER